MAFKWLDKFSEAMLRIPEGAMRERFAYALALYGATGELPALEWPLDAIVGAFLEDVDFSKAAMEQGARGGRPRRPGRPDAAPQQVAGVSGNPERGVSQTCERGVSGDAETQSIARQSNARQGSVEEHAPAPAPAMEPPSAEEVAAYARVQTLEVPDLEAEAGRFVNHFSAQGWVRGNGVPVRDWRPLWAKWVADRGRFAPRGQPAGAPAEELRARAADLAARYGEAARTEEVR